MDSKFKASDELNIGWSLFPAEPLQIERLAERRRSLTARVSVDDCGFEVFKGVYQTSIDTQLMVYALQHSNLSRGSLLEIGSGCGAISIIAAREFERVVGVDINADAVRNAIHNAINLRVSNVEFFVSDVFECVRGCFDVIVCNPPYNNHSAQDTVERMFWDPNDDMKVKFFSEVVHHLSPGGRILFGWADFADLDPLLPIRLAEEAGLEYRRQYLAPSRSGLHRFLVLEFCLGDRCIRS